MADEHLGAGFLPDVPALEDHKFTSLTSISDEVDLRSKFRHAIEHQGYTNSCVANASVSCLEYLLVRKYGSNQNFDFPELSRRFVYWEARKEDGLTKIDRGCHIRSAIKAMSKSGVCEESLFPFFATATAMSEAPFGACYTEGMKHRVLEYQRLEGLDMMLRCLSEGLPFIFGFRIYSASIEAAGRTGRMPMPAGSRKDGHAVCAVGYDKSSKEFIIRNSYGEKWGDRGYCTMPFDYVAHPDLSTDFWTIKDVQWDFDV